MASSQFGRRQSLRSPQGSRGWLSIKFGIHTYTNDGCEFENVAGKTEDEEGGSREANSQIQTLRRTGEGDGVNNLWSAPGIPGEDKDQKTVEHD